MLNICLNFEVELDIKFNQVKSFLCQFGLGHNITLVESLGGVVLSWVGRLNYFGVYLVQRKTFLLMSWLVIELNL